MESETMEETIEILKAHNEQLEKEVETQEEQIDDLTNEVTDLQAEVRDLENQIEERDESLVGIESTPQDIDFFDMLTNSYFHGAFDIQKFFKHIGFTNVKKEFDKFSNS
jgi:DNA repair exonuclease SbcCD ATPase subunit